MKPKIIFTEEAIGHILEAFELSTNEEGLIIDKQGELVKDMVHNETIHFKDLGGICSKGLIKSDLLSIISVCEDKNKE